MAACVAAGWPEPDARPALWEAYKAGGVEGARSRADAMVAERTPADVDPSTGEVIELADEDIPFGEDK